MVCDPAESVAIEPQTAEPPLSVTGEPNAAASIWNWMLPAAIDGVTVAVKFTDWPKTGAEGETATLVLEL